MVCVCVSPRVYIYVLMFMSYIYIHMHISVSMSIHLHMCMFEEYACMYAHLLKAFRPSKGFCLYGYDSPPCRVRIYDPCGYITYLLTKNEISI